MTIPFTTPGAFARALRRLAAAGVVALTVFAISASAASAGEHERIATKGGTVWFDHSGEYVAALDRRKDGLSVRAYLLWSAGTSDRDEQVTDNTGFTPGPNDPRRSVFRKLLIPEGTTVRLIMCYAKGDINRRCSKPQAAVA